jgi:hypothetical protein
MIGKKITAKDATMLYAVKYRWNPAGHELTSETTIRTATSFLLYAVTVDRAFPIEPEHA